MRIFTTGVFVFLWFCAPCQAGRTTGVRFGSQGDSSARIVIDLTEKTNFKIFPLQNPSRVVIDLPNTTNGVSEKSVGDLPSYLKDVRFGKNGKAARIVLETARETVIKKSFVLAPQSGFKWRLVVDLEILRDQPLKQVSAEWYDNSVSEQKPARKLDEQPKVKPLIVLDPGHGGKDPGAIGAYGKTYEKNITLAMGKELKAILEKRGYKVYLTRNTDIFIPLRQRVKIAQRYKADLFMSIHADSAVNRNAKGLSVYTLSETASDKEAAALAERENKVDIIGGVDFSENSKEINDILISLSQTDSRNKSSKFATYMVGEMQKTVQIVSNTHRFAGFAVLKAPDIPSALLEMGYLSNRKEESLLKQRNYRQKLAKSVSSAIDKYFNDPEIAALY